MSMIDCKGMIVSLLERIDSVREEKLSAGTKYRLMGLVADIAEVVQGLQEKVLARVSQEVVLDADVDIDYAELSEEVLAKELPERTEEAIREQTHLVNEALGGLSGVLVQIADQLERRHKDEEYAKLYETEKKRYMGSRAARKARRTFEEWKGYACYGYPQLENIEEYRVEKLLKMFEKGVLASQVEHIQRAKRYQGEVDFDQIDDNPKITKTVFHHYAALRKLTDFKDGCLVANPARVGAHFYACRHEANAKADRTNFLTYMYKVELAQEEYRRLRTAQQESAASGSLEVEQLNFFAPSKHLKLLLAEDWFSVLTADEESYTSQWTEQFVEALLHSEWGEQIARDWAVRDKRLTLKCMLVGGLKDAGVLRGSYNQIAKLLDMDGENPATLAKYLGMGKKQPYADWIVGYVQGASSD